MGLPEQRTVAQMAADSLESARSIADKDKRLCHLIGAADMMLVILADHQRRIAELEARLRDADAGEANEPEVPDLTGKFAVPTEAGPRSLGELMAEHFAAAREVGPPLEVWPRSAFTPTPVDDPNDPARRRR